MIIGQIPPSGEGSMPLRADFHGFRAWSLGHWHASGREMCVQAPAPSECWCRSPHDPSGHPHAGPDVSRTPAWNCGFGGSREALPRASPHCPTGSSRLVARWSRRICDGRRREVAGRHEQAHPAARVLSAAASAGARSWGARGGPLARLPLSLATPRARARRTGRRRLALAALWSRRHHGSLRH